MNSSIIPFSIGRRNCTGQALAKSEEFWIVSQLVREFEIHIVEEGNVAFCITLTTKGITLAFRAIILERWKHQSIASWHHRYFLSTYMSARQVRQGCNPSSAASLA